MERLEWALLATAGLAGTACVGAVVAPALEPAGYWALVGMGVVVSAVLLVAERSRSRGWRGWRLLGIAPLFPVLGAVLAAWDHVADPLHFAVLRWLPIVPGYALAVAGVLTLVDRPRLRTGRRLTIELALFFTACLVVVQLLIFGPDGRWSLLAVPGRVVLGAAVVVTSLAMAAALTLLGVVEPHRQRMALVLLAGAVALTTGRALGTAAALLSLDGVAQTGRLVILGGLTLLGLAVLADPGTRAGSVRRPSTGRSTELGHVLPHVAMLVAAGALAGGYLLGARPGVPAIVCAVACVALAAVHRAVTAREEQRLGAHLQRNEAYFRSLVSSGADAVLILDADLRITWASPALDRVLGDAAGRLPGTVLPEDVHPEDAAELALALPATGAVPAAGELLLFRLADADGAWHSLEASVSDLRDDADVGAVVLHCRDVTERLAREERLRGIAFTDPMTSLPNQAGFVRAVQAAQAAAGEDGTGAHVLLVDLQGLTEARDHLGRDVAAGVVSEIGARLRGTVRGDDVVARLSGGAFGVLAASTAAEADQLADRCLAVVEQPIATAAGIVDLTAGVGVVELEPALPVEDLQDRATLAVRAAHAAGLGRAARYTDALGEAAARRDRLFADLLDARARGELYVHYSPIVSLEEQRVTGVEAHLGWRHPEFGDVPKAEFLPMAERSGLIGELQRWGMEQAARGVLSLPSAGAPLRLGIDVTAAYVAGGTLAADVDAVLRRTGLAAERLVLEIAEATVLADDERIRMDIATVRLMGVHVALDHFGSSNSSLSTLTRLPIDILKLDRSFLSRVDRDPQERALCRALVGIGSALGVDVVAVGVETSAQLATLCGFACGFAQGFLLSRPLPLGELRALLHERSGSLWPGLVGQR